MAKVQICPKFEKCPLYNEKMKLFSQEVLEIYKRNYCLAGEENFSKCKRYIVAQITKVSPPVDILPNSLFSIEEIIEKMKSQGLIK